MHMRFLPVSLLVTTIVCARHGELLGYTIPCTYSFLTSDSINAESCKLYRRDGTATGRQGMLQCCCCDRTGFRWKRRDYQFWPRAIVCKHNGSVLPLEFLSQPNVTVQVSHNFQRTFSYTVPFSVISVEQSPRTDPYNELTAIETLLDDGEIGRCNVFSVSSFTKLNELPESIKVDKHLFPKITVVPAKDKYSGALCTEHNAGELTQADVRVVAEDELVHTSAK